MSQKKKRKRKRKSSCGNGHARWNRNKIIAGLRPSTFKLVFFWGFGFYTTICQYSLSTFHLEFNNLNSRVFNPKSQARRQEKNSHIHQIIKAGQSCPLSAGSARPIDRKTAPGQTPDHTQMSEVTLPTHLISLSRLHSQFAVCHRARHATQNHKSVTSWMYP